MRVVHTIREAREACSALRSQGARFALVPTMGALHAGHLALVEAAKTSCQVVAVSIFVNPTQFGPSEDFAQYPRTLEADCALLEQAGVDLAFAPSPAEMYPAGGQGLSVDPGPLGDRLDGRSRPGHFRGVATVVAKLFGIVQPERAFFGQKDAAQVAVLRAMVRDLNLPVLLEVCPTVREADGLALSSRNRYLPPADRVRALALSAGLREAERLAQTGVRSPAALLTAMQEALLKAGVQVDYVEAVDPDSLLPVAEVVEGTLLAVAAWVGTTRLIDNVLLRGLGRGERP